MDKFLFTDGTSGVREIYSMEELGSRLENTSNPETARIWIFHSNEWISYTSFREKYPVPVKKEVSNAALNMSALSEKTGRRKSWLKKFLLVSVAVTGVFLIFNFTKINWKKATPVNMVAAWPLNVPVMDTDSLIRSIEVSRGTYLDRTTRTNLRLRNTWPDRIELRVQSEKEEGGNGFRFYNAVVSIDNTTGFDLDKAIVRLNVWQNGKVKSMDTLRFDNITYDKPSSRILNESYRGDSIAVFFDMIRAKSFNFCYSAAVENKSGNYNDRWFCRE